MKLNEHLAFVAVVAKTAQIGILKILEKNFNSIKFTCLLPSLYTFGLKKKQKKKNQLNESVLFGSSEILKVSI